MEPATEPQHIFVYGTLRTAYSRFPLSIRSLRPPQVLQRPDQWVGTAVIDGFHLYDVGEYPGVVRSPDSSPVIGDVFRVDASDLPILDEYEGIDFPDKDFPPQEYQRVTVNARLTEGSNGALDKAMCCWLYLYNWDIPSQAVYIKSGDYVEYCENRLMRS